MATRSRVHIYYRVSSQGQKDGYSLATRRARVARGAAERGLAVASVEP